MRTFIFTLIFSCLVSLASAQNADFTEVNIEQVTAQGGNSGPQYNNGSILWNDDLLAGFTPFPLIGLLQNTTADASQVVRLNQQGEGNATTIRQSGNNNVATVQIRGNQNETSLDQRGTNLLSTIDLTGSFNTLDVRQQGLNLQNMILLEGNNNQFQINHTQQGLDVMQVNSSIPVRIQQTGGVVPVIIRSN